MTDATILHPAFARSPVEVVGIRSSGLATCSVPRRADCPASGCADRLRGERPLLDGIPASATGILERFGARVRHAGSNRVRKKRAIPPRRGASDSGGEGLLESIDAAARLREARRDARVAIRVSRIEPAEGAEMANRTSPSARRESNARRAEIQRRAIRRLDRDGANSDRVRSAFKRAHPASAGIHSAIGYESFALPLRDALKATQGRRAIGGERFDTPLGARFIDGIATNSRRFGMDRSRGES